MIFGFLFLDILLWGVFPLILLLLLWGDKKAWAATATVLGVGAWALFDWSGFSALFADKIAIGNLIKYVLYYVAIGTGFTFLKWKVLSLKVAKSLKEYLSSVSFDADPKTDPDNVAAVVQRNRAEAASYFNTYKNKYSAVLRVKAKEGSGWETSYNKMVLSQYIGSWLVYWPFYMVLLVIDDLLQHVWDWMVEVFGKGYQKLADASFSSIE